MSMNRRAGRRPGRGASSGLVWTPRAITGLQLWLRADMGITLNGGNVSAWADQSGTGDANKNVVQATAGLQPAFTAADGSYNSKSTVGFTGSQLLRSAAWAAALAQPLTRVVVGHGANDGTNNYFMDNLSGTQCAIIASSGAGLDMYDGATLTATGVTPSSPQAIVTVDNGASSKIYANAKTAKNTGAAGAGQINGTTIGNYQGGTTFALIGSIAEVLIYSGALSDATLLPLWAYLGSRYNITIGA